MTDQEVLQGMVRYLRRSMTGLSVGELAGMVGVSVQRVSGMALSKPRMFDHLSSDKSTKGGHGGGTYFPATVSMTDRAKRELARIRGGG
jgi:hypothetical protein